MPSEPERAYLTLYESRSFQSIKYQFTPDPNLFPLYHLFAGGEKIHIASFSAVLNQDL